MLAPRAGTAALRCSWRRYPVRKVAYRRYSVHASQSHHAASYTSPCGAIATELDRIAPQFEIDATQVEILKSPSSFYETLKSKILSAKKRIYLSTLYVGKTENELISTIDNALKNNLDLKVSILTDVLRGTREAPNTCCASLLANLVATHGDRVEIRMFHTPNLVGLRKRFIPQRINEGWGLQHMKLYGFDDEIMLSGANLSDDYFTNRVDRYHLFSSKDLANYFARIHNAVCSISFQVLPDPQSQQGFLLDWPSANGCPSPLEDPASFRQSSQERLNPLIQPFKQLNDSENQSGPRTLVYPLGQFTSLFKPDDTSTEFPALTQVLSMLSQSPIWKHSSWIFTAGYFNIHPQIANLLVSGAPSAVSRDNVCTVITASPWANGFFGSKGISGMLPDAYTYLSAKFLERVSQAGKENGIKLLEWRKGTVGEPGGWTYHAKGIWITPPSEPSRPTSEMHITSPENSGTSDLSRQSSIGPSITIIGSSNYTKRSYSLDLEVGALIVTEDEGLRKKLKEETEWLQEDARQITRQGLTHDPERKVSWKVKIAMWIVSVVGGAL